MAILSDQERIDLGYAMERLEQMPEFQIFHEKMQNEMVRLAREVTDKENNLTPTLDEVRYRQGKYKGIDYYRSFIRTAIKDGYEARERKERDKA